jgi:lipopolysaccharide transport system permease protein
MMDEQACPTIDVGEPGDANRSGALPEAAAGTPSRRLALTVIERRPGWQVVDFRELWRYRELFGFFVWRDVKVRYKQTVLGVLWTVLQPIATVLVFSVALGRIGGAGGSIKDYPLYVLAGIIPWTYFITTFSAAANSVLANQNLVMKVYFPRLLLPMSVVGANFVDFIISFCLLVLAMIYCQTSPGWSLLALPFILVILMMASFGAGALFAALIVSHRDFRFILGFAVQLWFFATLTIFLNTETMSPTLQNWLPLNPAQGLIDNFRRALLGRDLDLYSLSLSSAVSVALLLIGTFYFRRVERAFADVI